MYWIFLYNREIIKAEHSCNCRSWRTVEYSPKRKPQRYFQRFVQQPEKCKASLNWMRNGTILRKKKTFLKKFYFYVKTLSELIVQQCRTYTVKTRSFSKWRRTFQRLYDVWTQCPMAIKFSITLEYTFELPITVIQDILLLKIYVIKTFGTMNDVH